MRRACVLVVVALLVACDAGIYESAALPEQFELNIPPARRCTHCGWIESKREMARSVVDPLAVRVYEYTLRMPDGTSSLFQETLPAGWRLGERVGVIEGSAPPLN
jgi:hypothetical protein